MKASQYNIVVEEKEKGMHILFNTLYGSVLVFDGFEYSKITPLLENDRHSYDMDSEITSLLVKMKYLIEDDVDEIRIIADRKRAGVEDGNMMDLIVMPTLDCNFACSYCYLRSRTSMMSDESENAIIKYLDVSIPKFRLVNLLWFGGEPLLAYNRVVSITQHAKKVAEKHGAALMPHITTNGYLLNRKKAQELLAIGIYDYQITLDGPQETHDKLRVMKNGGPTFNIIFENTVALTEMDKRVNIALRVNFNHTNINAIPELLELFPENVRPQLRIVYEPIFGGCGASAIDNIPRGEMSKAITGHYSTAKDKGYSVIMGGLNVGRLVYCYAERVNQMVINYNGDVFKCSVRDFEPHERVGFIDADGRFVKDGEEWDRWFGIETFDKKCETCKFLPLCMGGCRSKRLERIADDSGDCCSLVPTNVSYTLKQVALGGFSELLGKMV